jgi:hypothetical protein
MYRDIYTSDVSLLQVSALHKCLHQEVFNVYKCVTVFYPLTRQRTILRVLRYLQRVPDDGTFDMPKHVEDLV